MKKAITILTMIFLSQFSFAQITTTSVAEKKVETNITQPYDSTKNFVGEDVYSLIGQTLYTPPKPENLQKYGYDGFLLDYKKDKFAKGNVYKCCDSYNSKYTEVKEKYFTVLDVFEHPNRDRNRSLYGTKYFLKLRENISKDTIYFEYDSRFAHSFCFVVMGFYEKQKKESIGKEFIIRGKNWRETVFNEDKPLYDIETGKEVKLIPGSVWKVIDLTIEEEYFSLSYIIQNDSGNKLTLDIISAHDSPRKTVFEKEKVSHIIKNYPDLWNKIVEGKVVVGMTEEMVILSWGKPEKINRASYGDQWVYGDQYLYFENGKLKSFN